MNITTRERDEDGPSAGGFAMFLGLVVLVGGVLWVYVTNAPKVAEGLGRGLRGGA